MIAKLFFSVSLVAALSGCATMGNIFNPFYDPPSPGALQGERNDNALYEGGGGSGGAQEGPRKALDALGTYQRAQLASPVKPVVNPAVIRLMWIPDRLNKNGDLVPAHYYYLRVKDEIFNTQDAFEIEAQLGKSGGGTASSSMPYYEGEQLGK